MPLVAAAFCPHPPLLVPEFAAGAAHELDDLRTACDAAIARLLAARPQSLVVLGSGPTTCEYQYPFHASFSPFGLPLEVRVGAGPPSGPPLPLSLAIGVWLLRRAMGAELAGVGALVADAASGGGGLGTLALHAATVAADAPVEACAALGGRYARMPAATGVLVMGDGSACRSDPAPGSLDPRAGEFDASVVKALADVDTPALLALDRGLAAELMVAGRAPWQVLAAAATGGELAGEVLYDAAPYGVNYTVAVWA